MKKWVVALVIGVAMLLVSTGAGGNDSNLIYCGSEIMGPGDRCESSNGTSRTFDEMEASAEASKRMFETWGRWALLGGGLALAALGIFGIVRTKRRRRAAGPTTADLHLAQYRQPAQPNVPHQPNVPVHPNVPHQANVPHQQPNYPPQPSFSPQPSYPPQNQYPPQGQYPQQAPHLPQNFGPRGPQD